MLNKKISLSLVSMCFFVWLMATVSIASAQTTAPVGATGGATAQNIATSILVAQGVAMAWGDATATSANFNFGNPATTSTTALPQQVQDAIAVGEYEAFIMTLQAFLF